MTTAQATAELPYASSGGRGFLGHPRGPRLSRLHRNVGALFLLRDDGAPCAVHDQAAAPARSCRACRRPRRAAPSVRVARADVRRRLRLADLRLVRRPRLFHAGARRARSPTAGSARAATVVLGALLMSAGHLAMSFDQSFLLALLLLIVGSGCLKGNISAQVGQLYPPDDESRADRGFTIFSAGDQHRRGARAAGLRRGRRHLWLARGLCARGGADDRRARSSISRASASSGKMPTTAGIRRAAAAADFGGAAAHRAADRRHRARRSCPASPTR